MTEPENPSPMGDSPALGILALAVESGLTMAESRYGVDSNERGQNAGKSQV